MKNYNELNASTEKDTETIVSIHAPKEVGPKIKKKKVTLISIFLSALKSDNFKPRESRENCPYFIPVPKYTLISFVLMASIMLILIILNTFVDSLIMIPFLLVYTAIAMPCLIIVFFIEFNTRKSISAMNIILMCIMGILSYAIISTICSKFLIKFFYETYITSFAMPISWTVMLYILVFVFCNVLRLSKMPECILISVSFAVGFSIAQSLSSGFSSLFVTTQISIPGKSSFYPLQIIINENEDLITSLNQLKTGCFITFIYKPILSALLAVIVGTVVSTKESSKSLKRPMLKSLYLLILLELIIYIISVVTTNFIYFDVILRVLAIVSALFIASRLLNWCLAKESAYVS